MCFMFNKISTWRTLSMRCLDHTYLLWKCKKRTIPVTHIPHTSKHLCHESFHPAYSCLGTTVCFLVQKHFPKEASLPTFIWCKAHKWGTGNLLWLGFVQCLTQYRVLFECARTLAFKTFFPLMSLLFNLFFYGHLGLPFLFALLSS